MTDEETIQLEPTTLRVESGVTFEAAPDTKVSVQATFIEAGTQLQQVFLGLEPVLLVQPEYDADTDEATFVVTTVDLAPGGLVQVLEILLDSARTILQEETEAFYEEQPHADS